MCGITGYISNQVDPVLTKRMTDLMIHRGPDSEGFFHGEKVALGMRRLAIIDRSGGDQPVVNETGDLTLVFNGEIYNYLALRRELENKGHRFKTKSDTEVLIHGFEEWGANGLPERLNGMFAFAIWDKHSKTMFIVRDRLGIKPLYYTKVNGAFYFASEIKCFLAVDRISLEPNTAAIAEYLALRYVPTPNTMFKNIFKLPGGHSIFVNLNGDIKVNQYWHPFTPTDKLSDEEYIEHFGEIFLDSVKIRMMSEVPLGAYLSAGLDSNMITWAMTQKSVNQVTTYSIGFGGKHDETKDAHDSARILKTDHNEILFDKSDLNLLPKAIWHLDEPLGDAHIVPSYILAREAKKDLTVVLLGEGADESLYGYPFYKVAWLGRYLSRISPKLFVKNVLPKIVDIFPIQLLNAVFPMPTSLGQDGKRHLKHFIHDIPDQNGASVFRILSGLFYHDDLSDIFLSNPETDSRFNVDYFTQQNGDMSPDMLLKQINEAQFAGWLQDNILLRHDKMAMAHSVECRVPFLDHRLVEFMAGVPRRLKCSGWKDKILSRKYAAKHLPADIVKRPKTPFFIPVENFLNTKIFQKLVNENLNKARLRRRGYFNPEAVEKLIRRAGSNNFLAVKRITSLIILELWHRIFIDREVRFYS